MKIKNTKLLQYFGRAIILSFALIPRGLCLAGARVFGRLLFGLMKSRAQVALDNLQMVYGQSLPKAEQRRIARENFAHISELLFEVLHVVAKPKRLPFVISVEGMKYLETVLAQGKGAVLFSAHMGNFLLMTPPLMDLLPQLKFIFREPADPLANEIYRWAINRMHVRVIADNPRTKCAVQCLKHLRAQGVLGVLIDQVETGGVYVDFMGHPAGSTIGAASLALKSGAPLLPLYCIRLPDRRLKVILGPEFKIHRQGQEEKLVKDAVAAMNKVVEQWVRQYPIQWFWGHRRWRAWRK